MKEEELTRRNTFAESCAKANESKLVKGVLRVLLSDLLFFFSYMAVVFSAALMFKPVAGEMRF